MQSEPSLQQLAQDALSEMGAIIRNEVRLAQTEATERFTALGSGVAMLAGALALTGAAATLLLLVVAYALDALLPLWAAGLLAALIGGALAYAAAQAGVKAMRTPKPLPRTRAQIAKDISMIKEKVQP